MTWTSKTHQFNSRELGYIEQLSAEDLVIPLTGSTPVVTLRALAEIMENGDDEKLNELLQNPDVNACWQAFEQDMGVDPRDHRYAEKLRARLNTGN